MKITLSQAQARNAALYREYARLAPWNSKTRAEWLRLAEAAEKHVTKETLKP